MRLKEISQFAAVPDEAGEIIFTGICNNSKKIKPGDLFIAVPGCKTDGFLYIEEAFSRGAVAALAEKGTPKSLGQPVLAVENIRKKQALIAAEFFGKPATKLRTIGVTGTNGKTTVTHLIEYLLNTAGKPTGLIGTVWIDDGKARERSDRTTPDSIELQRLLAEMVQNEVHTVVMEVSSHALALERVAGIDFDVAVLTNVTHDHFDFHRDYHHYLQSKLLLFEGLKAEPGGNKYAVANIDDPSFARIMEICQVPVYSYGFLKSANTRIKGVQRGGFTSTLHISLFGGEFKVETRLPGGFNIYNILAAVTTGFQEGIQPDQLKQGIATFPGVPGRYQEINCGQPFRVMVDFAHNPAALENILKMAKENTRGRRIVVFGCEGEKDRLKRPLMGKIAVENAEVPILTADNIHHEDLDQIFEDVLKDLQPEERQRILVEPDRGEAIKKAVALAKSGDFLIVAGKGHEEYLVKGSEYHRFNDLSVLREILAENWSASKV
ncbi:MAG: UDP-N-acetylmuramoyl-L-alanyl-D-glutamate--2,6-diaminopimelate ligase [Bacillota bacterium]